MSDGKAKGGGAGYDFEVFREACKQGDVFIFKISEVKKDAKRLNLFSEKEIFTICGAAARSLNVQRLSAT